MKFGTNKNKCLTSAFEIALDLHINKVGGLCRLNESNALVREMTFLQNARHFPEIHISLL